ncbi:MAG TPA: ATP-binding protein, partial [Candidatus Elarobacter sp.]|nr:ATP-binding protein [Candidatus Elarobacter sp.]
SRRYAAHKGDELDVVDVEPIAQGQMALEDAHRQRASTLIVQDTDLLSTLVYGSHYYDYRPRWLVDAVQARRPDLYLLLEIDVPWTPDGVRDRGHAREAMQQLFRDAVAASGSPYAVIRGSWNERLELARDAIGHLLAARE